MASGRRHAKPVLATPAGTDPDRLFRDHSTWLMGALRQRYGHDLADDLAQDIYLGLVRRTKPVEILKPKPYLLKVARNLFLTAYRRERRRLEIEAPHFENQAQFTAGDQLETVILKETILGMPQKLRDVFVLSRLAGMNNEAIAQHLSIRPKTAEWRLTKALAHCAAALRD